MPDYFLFFFYSIPIRKSNMSKNTYEIMKKIIEVKVEFCIHVKWSSHDINKNLYRSCFVEKICRNSDKEKNVKI